MELSKRRGYVVSDTVSVVRRTRVGDGIQCVSGRNSFVSDSQYLKSAVAHTRLRVNWLTHPTFRSSFYLAKSTTRRLTLIIISALFPIAMRSVEKAKALPFAEIIWDPIFIPTVSRRKLHRVTDRSVQRPLCVCLVWQNTSPQSRYVISARANIFQNAPCESHMHV